MAKNAVRFNMLQKPIPFEFTSFPAIVISTYVQIEHLDLRKFIFFK